jgi:hypothetical protein
LLATRDFLPDDLIAEVEGVLRHKNDIKDDTYCLYVDGEHLFDMVDQTRWINHSCEPNAEVEVEFDESGVTSARIVAIRPIAAGEEITYHYAFSQEVAEPCLCRTASCNGWIVDPDELHLLLDRIAGEKAAREARESKDAKGGRGARQPAADLAG